MKFFVFALFALVALAATCTVAIEAREENAFSLKVPEREYVVAERAERHRRVTCSPFSYACAAACLTRGKSGGRCIGNVCRCHKTPLKRAR